MADTIKEFVRDYWIAGASIRVTSSWVKMTADEVRILNTNTLRDEPRSDDQPHH